MISDEPSVPGSTSGGWGQAQEVPGTATLNKGGSAEILSVSCASPGNCSAGGSYYDASHHLQAFVVNETKGTWGKAEEVPGTVKLNAGGWAVIGSVSCAAVGICTTGGYYTDASHRVQIFVVDETKGTWGKAEEVLGLPKRGPGMPRVFSLSCASPGNCGAGGFYQYGYYGLQAFVVDETKGTWGKAEQVPGMSKLSPFGVGGVESVSCASPGNCSAGGSYADGFNQKADGYYGQAFVMNETNGAWGQAKEVPGTAKLNKGRDAAVSSLSCASPGTCSAAGSYKDSSGHSQAFVVDETNGVWGRAQKVPGMARLKALGAVIGSVSCASPGNCSAGGGYMDRSGNGRAFVVSSG
jgi:hypothetical protein